MAIREHLFLAPCVRATGGEGGHTQVYPSRIKKQGLLKYEVVNLETMRTPVNQVFE